MKYTKYDLPDGKIIISINPDVVYMERYKRIFGNRYSFNRN
jgi:hypothetical protein